MRVPSRPEPERLYAALTVDQIAAQALAACRVDLRARPFAVVQQNADSHKAAVLACSPSARQLGVQPGVPVFVMRRRVGRQVTVLRREPQLEQQVMEALESTLLRWTPAVEVVGTRGRVFVDLSGTPAQRSLGWKELGSHLHRSALAQGLEDVAVGLSSSRLVARMLARQAQPRGVQICAAGGEAERLYGLVRGLDVGGIPVRQPQLSGESVLERDINDQFLLEQQARLVTDRLCDRLRREGCLAGRLTFQLRYTDNRAAQRSVQLSAATDDFRVLSEAAVGLFRQTYQRRVAIKSMRVAVSRPSRASGQLDLFASRAQHRQHSLGAAITDIRTRMGFDAVLSATSLAKAPADSTCG